MGWSVWSVLSGCNGHTGTDATIKADATTYGVSAARRLLRGLTLEEIAQSDFHDSGALWLNSLASAVFVELMQQLRCYAHAEEYAVLALVFVRHVKLRESYSSTCVIHPVAKSDAKRTVNPRQAGQQSDDCGQLVRASG